MNSLPVGDPFEVWFVPAAGASLRLGSPLRIGQPVADQDDAQDLAEVAATDLPAYGFPRGQVLIHQNASVVRVLPTIPCPTDQQSLPSSRAEVAAESSARPRREVARMALEDLRQHVNRAQPTQVAPPAWIACLDQALRVIASPDDQRCYRLDGQPGVTVEMLHQRINTVLREFDHLVTAALTDGTRISG